MIGHGPDRGKVLSKMLDLFSHMPDKDDAGGLDKSSPGGEAGETGLSGGAGSPLVGNGAPAHVSPHVAPKAAGLFNPLGHGKARR